jgi:ABC-2 type transport system permease protein
MKAYFSILSSRFQTLLQYRAAAAAGIITQIFWGIVRTMIFDSFYKSSPTPQPLSHEQAIAYIWLGQAMLLLTILSADTDIAAMIRNGSVAYEMTRPLDLYAFWFCRALSGRVAPLLLRSLPIFAVAGLFFGLSAPDSVEAGALFLVSAFMGLLTAASLIALMTISLLWTISGEGISRLAPGAIFVLSGIVVPLPLLPAWAQRIAEALPFRGLIDTPFRLYLGQLQGTPAVAALLLQAAWLAVLILMGRVALTRGTRRLVVQGG